MCCDPCILKGDSGADLPLERFLEELIACNGCAEVESGPPALRIAVDRLRQSARALRKTQSKLRQREQELSAALEASAQYEARIDNMSRVYKQSTRELEPKLAVVERQAETIRSLSAPILDVGDGVVAMPIIGSLDEERAKLMASSLLERIHKQRIRLAILDLTGLEDADVSTARVLEQVCAAVRLLGSQVVLCGLGSRVAHELVMRGADLSSMRTLPTLRSALQRCR